MKTIIHVNQHNIKHNRKWNGIMRKVLSVKNYKSTIYCNEAVLYGPSKVVYNPDKPLSCGAEVWIETNCEVKTL